MCTANFYATFKSINFYQNILKIKFLSLKFLSKYPFFLQKNAVFLCWGLRLQISVLPVAARGFVPRPSKHLPIANFLLRSWWFYCCNVILCKPILRLAGVRGFPQEALPLNKFAHPCSSVLSQMISEVKIKNQNCF